MRNLKNKLAKEFDASEKLKELNRKGELKRRQLDKENKNLKTKEKQLKEELATERSLVEDRDRLGCFSGIFISKLRFESMIFSTFTRKEP